MLLDTRPARPAPDRAETQLTREDRSVPDVSLYVAAITAGAAVLGAGVSFIPVTCGMSARLARIGVSGTRTRGAKRVLTCWAQPRTCGPPWANAADYHGEEMPTRLAQVRKYAAAVRSMRRTSSS